MLTLITPPLLHPNTPYAATPVLTQALKARGFQVTQRDFSLETLLRVFTPETVRQAEAAARKMPRRDDALEYFLYAADDYFHTVAPVMEFLQGLRPELAWRIAARTYLPEGPFFQSLFTDDAEDSDKETLNAAFGFAGTQDQAKFIASLYLDDLASFIQKTLDTDFQFGKYAESLCISLPTMEPFLQRLQEKPEKLVEKIIAELTTELISSEHPDFIGISVPFPGTLLGAFRIAQSVRTLSPETRLILGGGFVNSELRNMEDTRIFDYFDFVCFDDGLPPLIAILNGDSNHTQVKTRHPADTPEPASEINAKPLLVPDFNGLDLNRYFDVIETPNPMQRLWTDGKWLKMQLAKGCYWHKCAFCDLALDYICHYQPAPAKDIVDAMERLVAETGHSGFHFVDEAIAPSLVRQVSEEIIRRRLPVTWWGNIRFDNAFTPELAMLMADAGCIAVTGGLECAHDRLLKMMNKGITLASARKAFEAFADADIMVHAYLMYAFPTETEKEAFDALDFVRRCFADGLLHSAYWHRFALTAHSAIAARPQDFGIRILPQKLDGPRFALNEIPYAESSAPDWDRIGQALKKALYNYMLGLGLDIPPKKWLQMV